MASFAIEGELLEIAPLSRGHIHDTFVSLWRKGGVQQRYLHQRVNVDVFQDHVGLMHNIERVTTHLSGKVKDSDSLETLVLVPTRAGVSYLDCDLGIWRTYHFIDGALSHDRCVDANQAHEAGLAFGHFQSQLADMDPRDLREVLPSFFSSPHRMRQYDAARESNRSGRVADCAEEIAFVEARRSMVTVIEDRLADGRIPCRVVHGDTKLNNVLFDARSGKARAVVDLDTCMPGYSLYDFGDLVRFTAATSSEDERDLSRAGIDLTLYRALARGFLEGVGDGLNQEERDLMPFSARLVTFTIGLRFLTDHLAGDIYFKIEREGHNLDRARVQLRMVQQMEELEGEMDIRQVTRAR
ncbi:MAG: N-acetylhexosamine 1-kinase [Planctomycetota bacterium]